jgi:hypothetical protein
VAVRGNVPGVRRFGGLAVGVADERPHPKSWDRGVVGGVVGEERLGTRLDAVATNDIAVLQDSRIPGS